MSGSIRFKPKITRRLSSFMYKENYEFLNEGSIVQKTDFRFFYEALNKVTLVNNCSML